MTQKLSSEKLMATLLQSIDPGLIADEGVRQTVDISKNYQALTVTIFERAIASSSR